MGEERSENRDNLYRFLVDPMVVVVVVVMGGWETKPNRRWLAPAGCATAHRTLVCTTVLPRFTYPSAGVAYSTRAAQHRTAGGIGIHMRQTRLVSPRLLPQAGALFAADRGGGRGVDMAPRKP